MPKKPRKQKIPCTPKKPGLEKHQRSQTDKKSKHLIK